MTNINGKNTKNTFKILLTFRSKIPFLQSIHCPSFMFYLFKDNCDAIQDSVMLHFLVFFIILPPNIHAFHLQGNIKKTQNKNQNTLVKFSIITRAPGKEAVYPHCWRNLHKICCYLYRFRVIMCKEVKLI